MPPVIGGARWSCQVLRRSVAQALRLREVLQIAPIPHNQVGLDHSGKRRDN